MTLAVVLGCGAAKPNPEDIHNTNVVTMVDTHTPGVAFVIVRPDYDHRPNVPAPPDPGRFRREYILMCDARPADGMHCDLPSEAALQRISEHPNMKPAPQSIDLGIGTIKRDKDEEAKEAKDEAEGKGETKK